MSEEVPQTQQHLPCGICAVIAGPFRPYEGVFTVAVVEYRVGIQPLRRSPAGIEKVGDIVYVKPDLYGMDSLPVNVETYVLGKPEVEAALPWCHCASPL